MLTNEQSREMNRRLTAVEDYLDQIKPFDLCVRSWYNGK